MNNNENLESEESQKLNVSTKPSTENLGLKFDASELIKSGLKLGISDIIGQIASEVGNIFDLTKSFERMRYLDEESTEIIKSLGLGNQRAEEFRDLISSAADNYVGLGLDLDEIGKDYLELAAVFQTNIAVSDETMTELAATTLVTKQGTKELASAFRQVGVDVGNIAPQMMDVVDVAKQSGIVVSSVAKGVTDNIGKLQLYNFDGGVKGLARMAAEAARLGVGMETIFGFAEKVFNPEGAIETAAALQRLGVTSSKLLDPLSLMDMSQNNPEELLTSIKEMSSSFVEFNEQTKGFEIMKGEKRRVREIAEELGMANGEFQKLIVNQANFEYKMKSIRFLPGTSQEDRKLIATLAQINEKGVAEVKIKQLDETGKWTGDYIKKAADSLNKFEIASLKEQQELQGATMEEIAVKQYGQLEGLNLKLTELKTALLFGATRTTALKEGYKMATEGAKEQIFGGGGKTGVINPKVMETEYFELYLNDRFEVLGAGIDDLINQVKNADSIDDFFTATSTLFDTVTNFFSGFDLEGFMGGDTKVLDLLEQKNKIQNNKIEEKLGTEIGYINSNINNNSNLSEYVSKNINTNVNVNEKLEVKVEFKVDETVASTMKDIVIDQMNQHFSAQGGSKSLLDITQAIDKFRNQQNLIISEDKVI